MLGRTYEREACSAARALEIAGERWSLLILRNAAFAGMTRFNQFQASLGVAPNILAARLNHFVAEGLMTPSTGPTGSPEYRLTEKGLAFKPVIVALTEWGDRWAAPDGAPIVFEHEQCGGHVRSTLRCERCAKSAGTDEVIAKHTPAMARAKQHRQAAASKSRQRPLR